MLFSAIIRTKLKKKKSTRTIYKRINIYQPRVFQYCHFGTVNPRTVKLFIKILLTEILVNCKLVHTSRYNQ